MRDLAIAYLKELNKSKDASEIVTRLYYSESDYVQDLSFYMYNKDYFSESLFNAIQNGQTLTAEQEQELELFTIVKRIELENSESSIIQNITFNISNISSESDTDVKNLSEAIIKSLKRQQGMR